jgi:hypothetical protein
MNSDICGIDQGRSQDRARRASRIWKIDLREASDNKPVKDVNRLRAKIGIVKQEIDVDLRICETDVLEASFGNTSHPCKIFVAPTATAREPKACVLH